jgi:hypothetical protein
MGIGDWGLGIGDWAQSPIPNPHPQTRTLLKKLKNNFTKKYSSYLAQLDRINESTLNILEKINSYIGKYEEVEKILSSSSFEITESEINCIKGILISVENNIKLKNQLKENYSNCNLSELKKLIQERIIDLSHEVDELNINSKENYNFDNSLKNLKKINSSIEYEINGKELKIENSSFKITQNNITRPKCNFAFYN